MMKFLTVILMVAVSEITHGAIEDVLSGCCVSGSDWASRSEKCDDYPESFLLGIQEIDQPSCRSILEVCCMKEKQKKQCDRGHEYALESSTCTMDSDVFGSEQYMECCHCCQLGLAQKLVGGDCNYLSSNAFGGPCDQKFKECCIGTNETEIDINECELYSSKLCSHICIDTPGSFRCECNPGFILHSDERTCIEQKSAGVSCALYNPCDQQCRDDDDGIQCSCDSGYQLNSDGRTCSDINECTTAGICSNTTECINMLGSYRCQPSPVTACPRGYEFDVSNQQCMPVLPDCPAGSDYNPDTRRCEEPRVECDVGFGFNTISRQCEDEDECATGKHNCLADDMDCVNTLGSFRCRCRSGFRYHPRLRTCFDIDECAANQDTCLASQRCENTIGSFICRRILGCGTGYTLDGSTQTCVDRDECAQNTHNCGSGYSCFNIQGSFRCIPNECQQGFRFSPATGRCERINCRRGLRADRRGLCVDIDECERPNICPDHQRCVNNYGSYRCQNKFNCRTGFEVRPGSSTCVDIDECERGHNCKSNQQCINRPGSFICDCPTGYRNDQFRNCQDIDECRDSFVCPFNAQCVNNPGSYDCICNPGLRSLGRRCIDINECEDRNRCQHRCLNVYGSFHCQCNTGYQLAADKRSCDDIDECTQFSARTRLCGGNCVNTPGSYRCSCPEGWTSVAGGRSCKDVDECRQRPGICPGANSICFNTKGSYKCPDVVCPEGFIRMPLGRRGNSVRCKRVRFKCPENDRECEMAPISISYNFISFPDEIKIPADLFAMSGPISSDTFFSWDLRVLKARPLRAGVTQANEGYFRLKEKSSEAVLSLQYKIPGPQDLELELKMTMSNRLGNTKEAVSKIYLYVSGSDIKSF